MCVCVCACVRVCACMCVRVLTYTCTHCCTLFISLYTNAHRMLDHPNLCKFIGATVNSPRNLAIISEYCPKGSLNDVLQNEDIPLNWGFRFSFATDVARGMTYLHQRRMYHGRLCSSNCVIDDRWVIKISGEPTISNIFITV